MERDLEQLSVENPVFHQWPVEYPAGAYLPVVVKGRDGATSAAEMLVDNPVPQLFADFARVVAQLQRELASVREDIADVRSEMPAAQPASSLRERALLVSVEGMAGKVRSLADEVAGFRSAEEKREAERRARELRDRMRRFSD